MHVKFCSDSGENILFVRTVRTSALLRKCRTIVLKKFHLLNVVLFCSITIVFSVFSTERDPVKFRLSTFSSLFSFLHTHIHTHTDIYFRLKEPHEKKCF